MVLHSVGKNGYSHFWMFFFGGVTDFWRCNRPSGYYTERKAVGSDWNNTHGAGVNMVENLKGGGARNISLHNIYQSWSFTPKSLRRT